MTPARLKIFRWRAVGPLLLFLVLLAVLWVVFADTIARRQAESNLSQLLGTEVDIASLRIREADAAVDIGGLQIADPRHRERNLLEAGTITLDLDPIPLTEKKLVVDDLRLSGLRFLTTRKRPARPADPNSPAGRLLQETEQWARDKFELPKLALGRIDTVKSLVLNPDQLGSLKAAQAFAGRVDSTSDGLQQALTGLQLQGLLDSSRTLASRLAQSDPKQLGVAGVRDAIASTRSTVDRLKQAKTQLAGLEQSAKAALTTLRQGLADVDAARQRDYAFAQGLLGLPSLDAPNVGAALFGRLSTDYFQQALFYARTVQRYVPPGLQPWNRPGPKRTRMAGTSVEFPKHEAYPRFLLRHGEIDLAAGAAGQSQFRADLADITSQPALYGRPARLLASGRMDSDQPVRVDLAAMSRHFGKSPKDSLVARLSGVNLPSIHLPELPFSVNPGRSTAGFAFTLAGDRLGGAWEIISDQATWSADSGRLAQASLVENTVWRVVSGLAQLRVRAELGGTIEHPTLQVRSNLDDAIAARLKGLVGEEVAKVEGKARAAVDALVNDQVTALQGKVSGLENQFADRLPADRGRLDEAQRQLEAQLKRLAGSATGGIRLPKL
ncbi:MAG TPA: TIGR03545 family protein [Gemmatimonadales bacterium]|jgi:uncharacterized protein (TIGR03545 family)